MKLSSIAVALFGLVATTFSPSFVDAHGHLMVPVSRESGSRADIENKVGCPSNKLGKSTSVQPGEQIKVRYPRNNHKGGFIRWAIVPRGEESKENFDKNVFFYTCRESGNCLPKGENTRYTGDNGAPANSILCGDTITLPDWLDEGDYVLQWTWMSTGSSFGNLEWANGQYRSCADLKFTAAGKGAEPSCPTFVGGDRVTTLENKGDDVCFYFYTNDLWTEIFKGEKGKADEYYKFGRPAEVEKCSGSSKPTPTSKPAKETGDEGEEEGEEEPTKPPSNSSAPAGSMCRTKKSLRR